MRIKCPDCNCIFYPFYDDLVLDDTTYDDQYVWVTIPVLRSVKTSLKYCPEFIAKCHHDEQHGCTRGDTDDDSLEEES